MQSVFADDLQEYRGISEHARFRCPSVVLSLRALWIALALAIIVHGSVSRLGGLTEAQKAAKPLTTQFIKRRPRLTKPLEMKKRPRPKRRRLQRKMVSVEAKANRQQAFSRVRSTEVMRSLAKPQVRMTRSVSVDQGTLEPTAFTEQVTGRKEAQNIVDMSLEMVDVEALDTGQYQAMVIQDPNDKRTLYGFFHMILTYSATLREDGFGPRLQAEMWHGIRRLVERLNESTDIRADVWGQKHTYDAAEMLEVPWVYARMLSPNFTQAERENIGRYMITGGFFILTVGTDIGPDQNGYHEVELALSTAGYRPYVDWDFERLPNSHPLYHCYYDFDDGPPHGFDLEYAPYRPATIPVDYVEGVHLGDRLVCVLEHQMFAMTWYYFGRTTSYGAQQRLNPERLSQFGINTIIFALTQEGSITRRVMNTVHY